VPLRRGRHLHVDIEEATANGRERHAM
jgi:hypothetical protein